MSSAFRESVLVIGASGRTGRFVLRYLASAAVPAIACVRNAARVPAEPLLAATEIAVADLTQPQRLAPLIERAAHVIYLAGSERKRLSAGAWQLEIDSLSACVDLAQRSGLPGRWIQMGYSGHESRLPANWAETRWREMKLAADEVLAASTLNYFVLRTGLLTEPVGGEPRVLVSQQQDLPSAELPHNVAAFLLTGVALAGAAPRAAATVRLQIAGATLHGAVQSFARLRTDRMPARVAL
jgi:NAD(P)-dependent dehydrogenase (short-subunit alcohol dehydrogenase family)